MSKPTRKPPKGARLPTYAKHIPPCTTGQIFTRADFGHDWPVRRR